MRWFANEPNLNFDSFWLPATLPLMVFRGWWKLEEGTPLKTFRLMKVRAGQPFGLMQISKIAKFVSTKISPHCGNWTAAAEALILRRYLDKHSHNIGVEMLDSECCVYSYNFAKGKSILWSLTLLEKLLLVIASIRDTPHLRLEHVD